MEIAEMFETYYGRVYSFTLFRARNAQDAEDITSEVFYRAAKNMAGFDETKASLSTWLFTIAVNETRRHFHERKNALPLEYAENLPAGECVLENVLRNERAKELYAAMEQLGERQRNVLLLRYYGEMSNREIAGALGLTETNVETVLYRAKKKLRGILKKCEISENPRYKVVYGRTKEAGHA